MGPAQKKNMLISLKLVDKLPRAIRNLQKNSIPRSLFGLGAISHKLIFDKVVFVKNRAIASYV